MIETLAWVLPRPRQSKYKGGFPLHFEKKLYELLGIEATKETVLHPFGGHAEYGFRLDINPETNPDYIGDAHDMDIFSDSCWDCVVCDPPYNDEYSESLYKTGKLKWGRWTSEAVRVLKPNGYLVIYHYLATPTIPNTRLIKRIFLETRVWHKLRCVHIYQKDPK